MNCQQMPGIGDYRPAPTTNHASPCYDADSTVTRDDTIKTIAAFYWDRDIGEPMHADRLHEAMSEVLGSLDEKEIGEMGRIADHSPEELGPWLIAKATDYLQAECMERARAEVERQEVRDAEEAAFSRMEC